MDSRHGDQRSLLPIPDSSYPTGTEYDRKNDAGAKHCDTGRHKAGIHARAPHLEWDRDSLRAHESVATSHQESAGPILPMRGDSERSTPPSLWVRGGDETKVGGNLVNPDFSAEVTTFHLDQGKSGEPGDAGPAGIAGAGLEEGVGERRGRAGQRGESRKFVFFESCI